MIKFVFAQLFSTTRKSRGDKLQGDLIFFDTEAQINQISENKFLHKFRFGYLICGDEEKYSFSKEEFVRFLLDIIEKKENPILVAHNINYDLGITNLLDELQKRYVLEAASVDRGATYYIFRDNKKKILLFDSYNILPMPLADIARKMSAGEKVRIDDWENAKDEQIIERAKTDVIILRDVFIRFVNKLRELKISAQYTLSLTAFEHLLEEIKKKKIRLYVNYNKNPTQLLHELVSFRGGRVEAFRLGKIKNIYKLDVNSMYPYVMYSYNFPTRLRKVHNNIRPEELEEIIKNNTVVVDCEFHTTLPSDAHIGVLYRGKLIFPVGHHRYVLTTPEVAFLLERNLIRKVYTVYEYESRDFFRDMIEKLYNLRLEYKKQKDEVGTLAVKLLMNSLYGRFGYQQTVFVQKQKINEKYHDFFVEKNLGKELTFLASESFLVNRGFVAIASHVTAYARMYLTKLILEAGKDNVYYVDTDSLFVSEQGYERLKKYIDSKKLGALKLEGIYDEGEIRNLKNYTLRNGSEVVEKIKGIRKNAERIDENTFMQDKFYSLPASRKHTADGILVEKIIKKNKGIYDKGIVKENGEVIPLCVDTDWRDTEITVLKLVKGKIENTINVLLESLVE